MNAIFLAAALAAAPTGSTARTADEALEHVFREYLDELFKQEPLRATRLGAHEHDDRLEDLSAESRAAWLERDKRYRAALPKRIEVSELSPDGRVDFEILRSHLDREIWIAENTDPFAEDPRVYVGYATECAYLPLTQSSLPLEANLEYVITRLEFVPRIFEAAKATLANPPRVHTETAIDQTRGAITFYQEDIYKLAEQDHGEGPLAERCAAVVEALEDYLDFLETEIEPNAEGEWRLGREMFAEKLEHELGAGVKAEEVIADAEREAERVEAAMYTIVRQLWAETFPGQPLPPDDPEGRRETIARVLDETSKRHGEAETLVEDVLATVDRIKRFITEAEILTLPEPDRCRIEAMPEFLRGNSVAYLNPAPPFDPDGSSQYAISPPPTDWSPERVESFLREYNNAMLEVLTIHEAYPGHYTQLEYSNRTDSLIRRALQSGLFAEGWAVYTEAMMLDQGYGDGDLVLRLNQLKFYLRAVLNAILDYRMHCSNMTDAEALELLMGRGFQTEGEAVGKLIRSKQSSCQLSTYFVGRMAFQRLRREVQNAFGDKFKLKEFHESVLSHGTIPVRLLPELVHRDLGIEPE